MLDRQRRCCVPISSTKSPALLRITFHNFVWNQLKEFTPDLNALIRRHYKKKHHVPADPRVTPAATATN